MFRRAIVWPLVAAAVLGLAACGDAGGAIEVAMDEPSAPVSPSPTVVPPVEDPQPSPPTADEAGGGQEEEPAEPTAEPTPEPDDAPAPQAAAGQDQTIDRTQDRPAEPGADEEQAGEPDADGQDADRGDVGHDATIAIEQPARGSERAAGPVTAAGEATVYEGTVLLALVAPDGSVVEEAFTTATVGAPERGRWSYTFETVADVPGRWQVVASALDPSDGEGHPPARAETDFRVTGTE